jgi:SAM-dependent methyltransferase
MVDLYDTYRSFEENALARVRQKAFGDDFGQNSWTTADEYRRWAEWLALAASSHALEVASGSGGPAIRLAELTGARVTGIDVNTHGVTTALARAQERGLSDRVRFQVADASAPLPFGDQAFDAIVCVDAANHLPDRLKVLAEWRRVLVPGGRIVFTDPVVVTGLVSNEELAERSSIGWFVFAPPGENERLLEEAGLELVEREDASDNAATISRRRHDARAEEREALVRIEGEENFAQMQDFFLMVHRLTSERRLSRFAYRARRPS